MDAHSTSSLFDLLNNQDDTPVPYREGCAFFPPLQFVFEVLGVPELPKQLYESNHQPGWLTWKTFSKWMNNLPGITQIRPTQLQKFARMLDSNPTTRRLVEGSVRRDALWRPYPEWLSVISSVFESDVCTNHWADLLEAEWELMCKVMPGEPSVHAKCKALANSAQMVTLGASGSRERLLQLLVREPDPDKLLSAREFADYRIADLFSFLLRFTAWYVVDLSLRYWESAIERGKQNELLFEPLLPARQCSGGWSDPLETCLKYFAQCCECQEEESLSASLGRVWAEHYAMDRDAPDVTSRQRLLRDWLSAEKGRPKPSSVQSFGLAVAHKAAQVRECKTGDAGVEVMAMVFRFHFAETSRYVLGEMQKRGFPEELIEEVFDSYAQEYRKARRLLGKPLLEAEGAE